MAEARPAILRTIGLEGGWSNHPHDPGGKTYMGVTEARYPGLPAKLRAMPYTQAVEEVLRVFKRDYWDPIRLSEIDDQDVANEMLDTEINGGGPVRMVQRLCRALGHTEVKVDGQMGGITIRAINHLVGEPGGHDRILKGLNCQQGDRFIDLTEKDDLPSQPGKEPTHYRSFFRGWLDKRVQLRPTS